VKTFSTNGKGAGPEKRQRIGAGNKRETVVFSGVLRRKTLYKESDSDVSYLSAKSEQFGEID